MSVQNKMIELHTNKGGSVHVTDISGNDISVTPESQALSVRWSNGGFVWNRPLAIFVEQDGKVERVPIIDVTRILQIVLWGISAIFTIGIVAVNIRNSRKGA